MALLAKLWAALPHPMALAGRLMREGDEQLHRALQLLGLPVLSAGFLLLCGGQVFKGQDNTTAITALGGILAMYCWGVYKASKSLRQALAAAGVVPPSDEKGEA